MSEQETITTTRAEKRSRRTTTIIGLVVAAILILIIGSFVLMISAGVTGTVRDVIIILLELESLAVVALMLVWFIRSCSWSRCYARRSSR